MQKRERARFESHKICQVFLQILLFLIRSYVGLQRVNWSAIYATKYGWKGWFGLDVEGCSLSRTRAISERISLVLVRLSQRWINHAFCDFKEKWLCRDGSSSHRCHVPIWWMLSFLMLGDRRSHSSPSRYSRHNHRYCKMPRWDSIWDSNRCDVRDPHGNLVLHKTTSFAMDDLHDLDYTSSFRIPNSYFGLRVSIRLYVLTSLLLVHAILQAIKKVYLIRFYWRWAIKDQCRKKEWVMIKIKFIQINQRRLYQNTI